MANLDLAFVSLFWDLMNRKTGDISKVDVTLNKPTFDLSGKVEQAFPRSTPEEQGVDSAYMARFIDDLRTTQHVAVHEIMVLRHGHVIYEGAFDPYSAGVWHVTYSMCKSFTGMAIGCLIDEGLLHLDDSVTDILLPVDLLNPIRILERTRYANLTVRHLLTMQSGSSFNEVGAISGNEWIKGFFTASLKFEPGTRFDYNSMNSYILSAIVTKLTGKTMFEYLKERLFTPMGITRIFWENSPEGITKAGWGLFILQEDAAKLAQLYLNKGMWNGQRLLSEEWVRASSSPQVETGQESNPQYGYHIWMGDVPGSYMYNGMLGQNVYVYPDNDMIIVVNAGNDEVFSGGTMTHLIRSYFGAGYTPSAEALPANEEAVAALAKAQSLAEHTDKVEPVAVQEAHPIHKAFKRLFGRKETPAPVVDARTQIPEWLRQIDGCTYEMESASVGLFPLIMQVVHYNFTNGIRQLRFHIENDVLWLDFLEGNVWNSFAVGFYRSRHGAVILNEEEYLVGCLGRFGTNEDDEPVLILRIAYIEEATERLLRIIFHSKEAIELCWSEDPGRTIIKDTLATITTGSGNINPIADRLLEQVNPDLISNAMSYTINPRIMATLVQETPEAAEYTAAASSTESAEAADMTGTSSVAESAGNAGTTAE